MKHALHKRYFIGLMSGTSLDAIDAALVCVNPSTLELIDTHAQLFDNSFRERISELFEPGSNEIDKLGELDRELAKLSAECVNVLVQRNQLSPEDICAIGSHGQTIRHRPTGAHTGQPFTLQIGDPNTIAVLTGITTVADFRRKDLALGGQGAPLAPAFHAYLCATQSNECAILNIGGIANISVVHPGESSLMGFDVGPGNGLMDAWTQLNIGKPFDVNGAWAKAGRVHKGLLHALLSDHYFHQAPPKSTGKETFNLSWLNSFLRQAEFKHIPPEDVQSTLLELTAQSVATACSTHSQAHTLYLCGGGALNNTLVSRLESLLPKMKIRTTSDLGIAPMWVEAAAFAWLAQQCIDRLPGNNPEVTGASRTAILGGVYCP